MSNKEYRPLSRNGSWLNYRLSIIIFQNGDLDSTTLVSESMIALCLNFEGKWAAARISYRGVDVP